MTYNYFPIEISTANFVFSVYKRNFFKCWKLFYAIKRLLFLNFCIVVYNKLNLWCEN